MSQPSLRPSLGGVVSALSLVLLAACGGGGGSEDSNGSSNNRPAECFLTHDRECLTNSQLARKARKLTNNIEDEFISEVDRNWSRNPSFANAQKYPHYLINSFKAIANLELIRGYQDSLRPGKGVTIGILDNGIDLDHYVFTSRPENEERSISNTMMEEGATQNDHGTAVAGIAGGKYGAYGTNIKAMPFAWEMDQENTSQSHCDS